MVSLKQARAFQARLAAGEVVRLEAKVRAGRHAGEYEIATATIAVSPNRNTDEFMAIPCCRGRLVGRIAGRIRTAQAATHMPNTPPARESERDSARNC